MGIYDDVFSQPLFLIEADVQIADAHRSQPFPVSSLLLECPLYVIADGVGIIFCQPQADAELEFFGGGHVTVDNLAVGYEVQLNLVVQGHFVNSADPLVEDAPRKAIHLVETESHLFLGGYLLRAFQQVVELVALFFVCTFLEAEDLDYLERFPFAVVTYALVLRRQGIACISLLVG
ncbi:MAG: hypothetical protein PHW63_04920 [Alphaproteobacteria bacterium]|nr:hypothetical protein [Alphaproteobacteria bacterium]